MYKRNIFPLIGVVARPSPGTRKAKKASVKTHTPKQITRPQHTLRLTVICPDLKESNTTFTNPGYP